MTLALTFPAIDPVAIRDRPARDPLVRARLHRRHPARLAVCAAHLARAAACGAARAADVADIDDFLVWATLGIILGGRLGYVLFYEPDYYLARPARDPARLGRRHVVPRRPRSACILAIIAVRAAARHLDRWRSSTSSAAVAPIGLFFGRLANFINGELWGRPTDVPWAMVFPERRRRQPRHPSQLYEAALEGLVLFVVLRLLTHCAERSQRPGLIGGAFLAGYGARAHRRASSSASPTAARLPRRLGSPWACCCRCRCSLAGLVADRARRAATCRQAGASVTPLGARSSRRAHRGATARCRVAEYMALCLGDPEHGYYTHARSVRRAPATSSPRRRSARCSAS